MHRHLILVSCWQEKRKKKKTSRIVCRGVHDCGIKCVMSDNGSSIIVCGIIWTLGRTHDEKNALPCVCIYVCISLCVYVLKLLYSRRNVRYNTWSWFHHRCETNKFLYGTFAASCSLFFSFAHISRLYIFMYTYIYIIYCIMEDNTILSPSLIIHRARRNCDARKDLSSRK